MTDRSPPQSSPLPRDLLAGLVVFLIALPLCLGIALASGAPLISGIISGIIGGLVVGFLSGSHTSVSGPAAGLTAIVATQIGALGSFENFLLAVVLAGGIQILLGIIKAGYIASFCPSSVIKGLLAAIGVILILKQIPHVIGHDPDPVGEMAFDQPDGRNTFTELFDSLLSIHPGAAFIGLLSILLLLAWDKIPQLKKSPVPAPLLVVLFGLGGNFALISLDSPWAIGTSHLVQVPVAESVSAAAGLLSFPDFSALLNPTVYVAAITIAIVASLETLLNLEAVDRIDPAQRTSPPNRELIAQGAGNVAAGMVGGLPMTSVIVRSSVNINAGGKTKVSAITHGVLLLLAVLFIPKLLNQIPLSCLAAILFTTGLKLASPALFKKMWNAGRDQFLPFIFTVIPIVLLDLLTGILIGLAVSVAFILHSNFRSPIKRVIERYASGDVMRIQLANQVSFFNRATLEKALDEVPPEGRILLDARGTDYIDPDILSMIEDFRTQKAPTRHIELSFLGFKDHYADIDDNIQFIDHTNERLREALTPDEVLTLLREGNQRFITGQRLERDLLRQVRATAPAQSPLAVILSCIDSRTSAELIFDLGIGDIFSVRIAGNIARDKIVGSMEYGCAVAGAKLIAVIGHTACGAVTSAVDLFEQQKKASEVTGCQHLDGLIEEIQLSIDPNQLAHLDPGPVARKRFLDRVARRNVVNTIQRVRTESSTLDRLLKEEKIIIVGGLYDVTSGVVEFFDAEGIPYRPSTFVRSYASIPAKKPD